MRSTFSFSVFSDLVRSVAFGAVGDIKAVIRQASVFASFLGAADAFSALRENATILEVLVAAAIVAVSQAPSPL